MKSKIFSFLFIIFFNFSVSAENIFIQSKKINIDKKTELSVFENDVTITTSENNIIKSDFAEYDKKRGTIVLKKNVEVIDKDGNKLNTEQAIYNEKIKKFESFGYTKIFTKQDYVIESENIIFDDKNNLIISKNKTTITDKDKNKIFLNNFEYLTNDFIFKSVGEIKLIDNLDNTYNFSQIYIDTKKRELLGTDSKSYINNSDFKINTDNKPRIFANTVKINEEFSEFNKSNFTICNYRKNDKCPPWTIQSTKMLHDSRKKTIYYDNALIKVYDIPIFYFPKLSHPDPSVKRRSGFLNPSFHDTKNLGEGFTIPYFWAINKDKDLTLTSKLYIEENPLLMGEYRQAYDSAKLILDFGFTEGYKKNSTTKTSRAKSHFFTKFVKNFSNLENDTQSSLMITTQDSSNDKYFKLYDINSELINDDIHNLKNTLEFTHSDNDIFFGFNASMYETLNASYNDKYEYILPEITFNKNIYNNAKFGSIDYDSNIKIRNYDTNKTSKFFINNFEWNSIEKVSNFGLQTQLLGNLRNINYDNKNIDVYKEEYTNELFGAIGLLSKIDLYKKVNDISEHFFTPKFFIRYAPGKMRKEENTSKLSPTKAYSLNRINNEENFETGLSATLGFDYEIQKQDQLIDFSIAQIINQEENKSMPTSTSLDEKISDLVGSSSFKLNDKLKLDYNFAIDQNYNEFNYNEIGAKTNIGALNFDINYLQEKKHIGNNEYIKSNINYDLSKNTNLSYEFKRNLITNSSEFYNLSYEYLNDCLRAGLVYRREFYNDSELEPENSLMFKITLIPFGNIDAPKFNK